MSRFRCFESGWIRIALGCAGFACAGVRAQADDSQLRAGAVVVQPFTEHTNLTWRSELRFDNSLHRVGSTLSRASLGWRWRPTTQLTADVTYVDTRKKEALSGDTLNLEQTWIGVGQSSRWWLAEHWGVGLRDTLRWRFIEDQDDPTIMSRHTGELTWRTGRARGVQQIYCSFEWFAALSHKPRPEHWITPLGARIRGGEHWSVNLYYFIRRRQFDDGWRQQHVLGTFMNWQI